MRGYFTSIFTDIVLYYCYCCYSCSSFLTKTQNFCKNRNMKGALSGLRQFLATESPFSYKIMISFISPQKLFSFSRYWRFCLDFLYIYPKDFIKKIKVNFRFYDVTAWLRNNCNTHIAQYFEMSDFPSHACLH